MDRTGRYSGLSTVNHWITVLLVASMLTLGLAAGRAPGEEVEEYVIGAHISLGFFAFLFVVWRVGYRLYEGLPPAPGGTTLERWGAYLVQRLLLAVLMLQVRTGPLYLFTEGESVNVFGRLSVSLPLQSSESFHELMEEIHEVLGAYAIPMLLVVHVAGAIRHYLRAEAVPEARRAPADRQTGRSTRSDRFGSLSPSQGVRSRYRRSIPMTHGIPIALAISAGLAITPAAVAGDDDDDEELPFEEAHVFFELNHTDGDLGIHALIDGDAWKRLSIEDQHENTVLNVFVRGRLRKQGLTEIFFESAEPPFDELAPRKFFRRFPAGTYEIEGKTLEGDELESEVELTHRMPAPAEPTVNGMPMAEQCDGEEAGYDATLVGPPGTPVIIAWPAVDSTHPDLGSPRGSPEITIHNYEVVVEAELEGEDDEEFTTVFSALVPPDILSMTIPGEFLGQSDTFKYEVLAREESFNQTAVESCFVFDEDEDAD